METIRIDKMLSNVTNISRSEIKRFIKRGEVTVNGRVVKTADEKIDPESSEVKLKGQTIGYDEFVYIMLNKPKGILSASNDKSRKTVVDLVPDYMKRQKLFPVGRLDKDTTGLIIITNDGEYAHKIISPKNKTGKVYIARLDGELKEDLISEFKNGVVLADGTKCRPANLEILESNVARLTLFDGKYHEVKRMFGVFGLGVNELHRQAIGKLILPETLKSGECILMSAKDVEKTL
ncbi:MAG: rRNA pseudouridine synthase [Ruminococcaceae bacterium]|nr:rRNA pseudouridine synthase [Oscillospiraceae bacterium]